MGEIGRSDVGKYKVGSSEVGRKVGRKVGRSMASIEWSMIGKVWQARSIMEIGVFEKVLVPSMVGDFCSSASGCEELMEAAMEEREKVRTG